MTLTLRPVAPEDLPRVTYIRLAAFEGVPAARAARPGSNTTPEMLSWMGGRIKKDFQAPNITFLGVFDDDTNQPISYAEWETIDAYARGQPEQKIEWPSFMNEAALNEFWSRYERLKHEVTGDKDYLLLGVLATDKAHRGRGAASILLRWGVEQAQGKSLEIFLDALEAGKSVYERYGFETKEETKTDLRPYGGGHMNLNWGMVRVPGPIR